MNLAQYGYGIGSSYAGCGGIMQGIVIQEVGGFGTQWETGWNWCWGGCQTSCDDSLGDYCIAEQTYTNSLMYMSGSESSCNYEITKRDI